MTAVAVIIRSALGVLRVVDASEPPEAEDFADGVRALNAMMAAWLVDGWDIGWTPVAGPEDVLTTPEWADEAIIYNLALRLRPSYGASLDEDVIAMARAGMATVSAFVTRQVEADDRPRVGYCDLPRGTGQRVRGNFEEG